MLLLKSLYSRGHFFCDKAVVETKIFTQCPNFFPWQNFEKLLAVTNLLTGFESSND
jgi:hypothetical protein